MPESPNVIELKVDEVSQLFDTLDPFPFRERDLDKDAEEFIVGWARDLPRGTPIQIVIHLPKKEIQSAPARELPRALKRFFEYRAEVVGRELKELFRIGRHSLIVGVAVLAFCIFASEVVASVFGDSGFSHFFEQGFIILGWVANWKPLEIFLYDWWPVQRRRRLYRRLANADVKCAAS